MRNSRWVRLLAYVTGSVNQELLLRNEYLAAENRILRAKLASRLRLFQSGANHTGRDRKTSGTQSAPRSRLRCQSRYDLGVVSEARRPEVRWLPTPAESGPPCDF